MQVKKRNKDRAGNCDQGITNAGPLSPRGEEELGVRKGYFRLSLIRSSLSPRVHRAQRRAWNRATEAFAELAAISRLILGRESRQADKLQTDFFSSPAFHQNHDHDRTDGRVAVHLPRRRSSCRQTSGEAHRVQVTKLRTHFTIGPLL